MPASRVVNGVTSLPGSIAWCGQPSCGGALTPHSGEGGQYYYYTFIIRANQGASACDLQAIRRDELDSIVLGSLERFIFDPDRLRVILGHLLDRSDETEKRRRKDLGLARTELTNVARAITNLMLMIESGAMLPNETLFVDRMAHNRAVKRTLETDVLSLERRLSVSKKRIADEPINAFARKMAEALESGDPRFRAAYVRLFVERVEVSEAEIKISRTKTALERALVSDRTSQNGSVLFFDRKWCPRPDSNRHSFQNRILNPARLPIPPLGQRGMPLAKGELGCNRTLEESVVLSSSCKATASVEGRLSFMAVPGG